MMDQKGQKLGQHKIWKCFISYHYLIFFQEKYKFGGYSPPHLHGPNPSSSISLTTLLTNQLEILNVSVFSDISNEKASYMYLNKWQFSGADYRTENAEILISRLGSVALWVANWTLLFVFLATATDEFVYKLFVCTNGMWKLRNISLTELRLWILNTNKLAASVVVEISTGQHY